MTAQIAGHIHPDPRFEPSARVRAHAGDARNGLFRGAIDAALGADDAHEASALEEENKPERREDKGSDGERGDGPAVGWLRALLTGPLTVHSLNELLLVSDPAVLRAAGHGRGGAHAAGSGGDGGRSTAGRGDGVASGGDPRLPGHEGGREGARSEQAERAAAADPARPARIEAASREGGDSAGSRRDSAESRGERRAQSSPSAAQAGTEAAVQQQQRSAGGARTGAQAAQSVQGGAQTQPGGGAAGLGSERAGARQSRGARETGQAQSGRQGQAFRLDSARQEAVVSQVSRGLAAALERRSSDVTLRLKPESLGMVRVEVRVEEGRVEARFHAESEVARGLLEKSISELRSALESKGLNVDRLQVFTMQPQHAQPSQGDGLLARDDEPENRQERSEHHADGEGAMPSGRGYADPPVGDEGRDDERVQGEAAESVERAIGASIYTLGEADGPETGAVLRLDTVA